MPRPRNPQRGYIYFKCCVFFAVKYSNSNAQRMPYCPICGDDVDVKQYIREQTSWTDEERAELVRLHNKTAMTHTEIGKKLGRTKKAVTHQLSKLR